MTKTNRWMTWIIEDSAEIAKQSPNKRKARFMRSAHAAKLVEHDEARAA